MPHKHSSDSLVPGNRYRFVHAQETQQVKSSIPREKDAENWANLKEDAPLLANQTAKEVRSKQDDTEDGEIWYAVSENGADVDGKEVVDRCCEKVYE